MDTFSSEFFVNNRARLRSLFTGTAPIVLSANGLLQQNGDSTYPFRQDSSFWYFSGINEPGLILVLDKNKEYIITPIRSQFIDIAEGALDLGALSSQSGVEMILDEAAGWKMLGDRLKRARHAAILPSPGAYVEAYGFFSNPARARVHAKMKTYNSNLEFLDIRTHITKLRMTKQELEIDAIKSAIGITTKTLAKIHKNLRKFRSESEIDGFILNEFKVANAKCAFKSVVASGSNACPIHYNENSAKLNESDLVTLDIGAEISNYSSDITRTYSISKKPSRRQRQIFESVKQVQDYAVSLIKPGLLLLEYENLVEQFMGEQLRELGLIKTIDSKSVRQYYPHATSHHLGLDTHDIFDRDQPLEESMVLAVEPGIYIPEEGVGVRIEDDFMVTKTGNISLSANLPSELF